jgi:hypothetical protein
MAYLYYMKKLFFSIACILLMQTVRAQKDVLQFDENNKYVLYQVVEKQGMTADTLYQRAIAFVGKGVKHKDGTVSGKGKVVVYGNSLLTKKEAGEVAYTLTIDTKDQKYRYKFGDFIFKPYKLNRYGSMATQPGVEIPLEKVWTKYGEKDTDSYLSQVGAYCKASAAQLLQQMDRVQVLRKPEDNVKKVVTDKW